MDREQELSFYRDIYWKIGEYALGYDGYEIKRYLSSCNKLSISVIQGHNQFGTKFIIPDLLLLRRLLLFMLQRYFGKWGGERIGCEDRSYSEYYHLYLECYREDYRFIPLPKDNFDIAPMTTAQRERTAGKIRSIMLTSCYTKPDLLEDMSRRLKENVKKTHLIFSSSLEELDPRLFPKNLLKRPEVVLALCFDIKQIAGRLVQEEFGDLKQGRRRKEELEMQGVLFDLIETLVERREIPQDDLAVGVQMQMLEYLLAEKPETANFNSPEHILFALLYLQIYRHRFPVAYLNEPFFRIWCSIPAEVKEDAACRFRREISLMREEYLKKMYKKQEES